jgi:flavorubredoxin
VTEIRTTEIADGIFQFTTYLEEIDFGLNQYLVTGDEPLLFHTGLRSLFGPISGAVSRVVPLVELRWLSFGHVEADECGSLNQWLAAAPDAVAVASLTACMVSVDDIADRPPRGLADEEVLDVGGHRLRWLDTPHLPHGWEAGLLYDETTRTLFCGDLFAQWGPYPAVTVDDVDVPDVAEDPSCSLAPTGPGILRGLAELDIVTLAQMHGPASTGDANAALLALADAFEEELTSTRSVSAGLTSHHTEEE